MLVCMLVIHAFCRVISSVFFTGFPWFQWIRMIVSGSGDDDDDDINYVIRLYVGKINVRHFLIKLTFYKSLEVWRMLFYLLISRAKENKTQSAMIYFILILCWIDMVNLSVILWELETVDIKMYVQRSWLNFLLNVGEMERMSEKEMEWLVRLLMTIFNQIIALFHSKGLRICLSRKYHQQRNGGADGGGSSSENYEYKLKSKITTNITSWLP